MVDDADRIGQAQRAAGPGRSDFTHAVAGDGCRAHAFGFEQSGHADLEREQRRLGDFGPRQAIFAFDGVLLIDPLQLGTQREAGVAGEQRVDLIDGGSEDRGFVQQRTAHRRPLAAVAVVDEYRAETVVDPFANGGAGNTLGGGQGIQPGDRIGGVVAEQYRRVRMAFAAEGQAVGGVVERHVARGQVVAQASGELAQRFRAAGAQAQRQFADGCLGLAGCLGLQRLARRLQNDVGIGAAETERVDADGQLAFGFQLARLVYDVEIPACQVDPRVDLADTDSGGYFAFTQGIERLGQPRDAGGGLQVAEVALDRADRQRRLALLADRRPNGAGFQRVADGSAGAVGFQVVDVVRRQPGTRQGPAHQRDLGVGVGDGQAFLETVGIDAATGDDGQDPVAVGDSLVVVLEQEDAAALGAHVAIPGFVEDLTASGGREHARLGEDDEAERVQMQADAAGQRHFRFAAADRLARLVKGDQRRGAGGIHRHARAVQVEHVGDTVRGDARCVAGRGRGVDHRHVVGHAVRIVETGDTQEHATLAPA